MESIKVAAPARRYLVCKDAPKRASAMRSRRPGPIKKVKKAMPSRRHCGWEREAQPPTVSPDAVPLPARPIEESMTNINGVQPPAAAQPIEGLNPVGAVNRPLEAASISDVVEISSMAASLAAKVKEIPDVRTELVQRVKAEIAAGTYETPERIELAVDRLMDELFG